MRIGGLTMSIAVSTALLLAAAAPALLAQSGEPLQLTERKKAEQKKKVAPKTKAAPGKNTRKKANGKKADAKKDTKAPTASYAGMPVAERAAIQFDLNWTNHYTGPADGDFGDRSIAAVKAFQKDRRFQETGVLAENEREALATSALNRRERVGWRMVDDRVTGAQVWLPTKLATHESRGRTGTRWQSAQGQLQIETFRVREPGATLATVFEDQKKEPPNRQVATGALRGNSFVLTGMQGLKYFLVRAEIRDLEIRGVTVLYDQAIEETTNYVGLAVLSAFAPFPGTGVMSLIGPPSRSKIEYGSGIVVTDDGHVMTDRRITEGCNVLQVAGHGDASRIADQGNLSLLRVFGASELTPAAIVHEGASASALTLVGIADPQAQGGARAVSTVSARLNGDGLAPAPQLGFAGAAAIDSQGRIFGMVMLKAPVLASAGTTTLPAATIVPVNTIRRFLDMQYVTPATGPRGVDAAKASVVRVICVRK
ncbi:MAG: peptidoglycan-binding protein [Rhizobiales bacterium]|nr:peptidoglycan-binding protein [Hyphomicrobiales bacterium]